MSIHVFHSGANRTMKAGYVFASGANRPIKEIWIYHAGANRRVYASTPTASASPDYVTGHGNPGNPGDPRDILLITTNPTHVTVTGGIGPFTYQWVRVSGDTMNATAPTSPSTAFNASLSPLTTRIATWQCHVTDTATGLVVVTNPVTAVLSRTQL